MFSRLNRDVWSISNHGKWIACRAFAIANILCWGFVARAAEPTAEPTLVQKVVWKEQFEQKKLPEGATVVNDAVQGDVLRFERTKELPQSNLLLTIDQPKITAKSYVLQGKVKVEGVMQPGFLEMLNAFQAPIQGEFFTRSLDETGPMGKLVGDAPWREFQLPFYINVPEPAVPTKLKLNIHLPGSGTVYLTDLELREGLPAIPNAVPAAGSGISASLLIIAVVFIAGIGVVLFALAILLLYRWTASRKARDAELRRMRALDLG